MRSHRYLFACNLYIQAFPLEILFYDLRLKLARLTIWGYDLLLVMYALPPRETMAISRQAEGKNDHKRQGVFRSFNQQRAT